MSKRKFGDLQDEDLDKMMSNEGRLQEKTTKRRKSVLAAFRTFAYDEASVDLDQLILVKNDEHKSQLEKLMVKYLAKFTVKNKSSKKDETPKGTTFNSTASHLKCSLNELTGYDFSDQKGKILKLLKSIL